jgi:hypothetical protein
MMFGEEGGFLDVITVTMCAAYRARGDYADGIDIHGSTKQIVPFIEMKILGNYVYGWLTVYLYHSSNNSSQRASNHDVITFNECKDTISVSKGLTVSYDYTNVTTMKMTDGVSLFSGTSPNSIVINFEKWVVVVEAPISEERSLAVTDKSG